MVLKPLFYIGFLFFYLSVALPSVAASSAAAIVNGEAISFDSIEAESKQQVYEAKLALYELQYAGLRSALIEKLISLDSRSKGLSVDGFLSTYVVKPMSVSDSEVEQFIINRRIPREKVNTNLKEQVRRYIMQENVSKQIDSWVDSTIKKHDVEILLSKPSEPRTEIPIENAAYRGNKNAPVTIVEYSDFECPYCSRANDTLYELDKIYGDKIKVVYKHFPLASIHPVATKAAEASECARQQSNDSFWALHDKIFENFRGLSEGRIKDFAKELGLDMPRFNQCLTDGSAAKVVEQDLQQGLKFGVESTPAFFINGRFRKGAIPLERFKEIIDEELQLKK